jgi:hypothetical protein
MNYFKRTLLIVVLGQIPLIAQSQNKSTLNQAGKWESNAYTYGEFKAGYGLSMFSNGLEDRFENGNFSASGGSQASIAAYRKFEKLNNLHFGLKFKGLGAAPSTGDNGEEMFFNFWGTAISAKYFLWTKAAVKGTYLQADYNFITQFTQKYRNTSELSFDHQFAIGYSFTLGLGYQYPLRNGFGLVASLEYDWANRQGEVQGLGDQQFRNSNFAFQVGFIF